jgi:hypothetical protein
MWRQYLDRVILNVDRDSVAAGDDADPHEVEMEVDPRDRLADVIRAASTGYLATIAGGEATWLVATSRGGHPLAVVAQQWRDPVLLVGATTTIGSVGSSLYFRYLAQSDPATVVEGFRR